MNCPYCNKKMILGRLRTRQRNNIFWVSDKNIGTSRIMMFFKKKVLISKDSAPKKSYYCEICNKVIMEV